MIFYVKTDCWILCHDGELVGTGKENGFLIQKLRIVFLVTIIARVLIGHGGDAAQQRPSFNNFACNFIPANGISAEPRPGLQGDAIEESVFYTLINEVNFGGIRDAGGSQ